MASIKKLDSGKWRARYRDVAGKEHARHFERKVDGQQWLDRETAKLVRGDWVDPKAGKVTLRSYATDWEAIQVSSENTQRIVDNALRLHILPSLGDHPIATIRPSAVQAMIKQLETKGLAAGSIAGIYHVLTQVFSAAVEDRIVAASPCRRIALPKADDPEVVVPSVEEVVALADSIGPQWRALIVTLAGSGVRIGELLGLQVSDVDFLRKTIRVERQRNQAGQIRPPKSKSARRTIPVGKVVIDELAAHLAAYPSDGPLFVNEVGEPVLYRRWRTLNDAALRSANTKAAEALMERDKDATYVPIEVTAHTLRHFYASSLIAGGASVKQVQERLGHASPTITLEIYTHLWPGDDDRTRDVIDTALRPLADSLRTARASNA